MIILIGQFFAALFIRLGWHKYTDETVYAINPFVILFLVILGVAMSGTSHIMFMIGFFFIDFIFQLGKRNGKEITVINFITTLLNIMPKKKETPNE